MLLPSLAASRQIDPGKLSGLIKGDLDWIILKALEKERLPRYDTATALLADIERHLNDEPVVAVPPTVGYRAKKFVRKHRRSVIAGTTLAAVLILGILGTSWGLWKATIATKRLTGEHDRAMETLKELVNRLGEIGMENDDGTLSVPKVTTTWDLSKMNAGKTIEMGYTFDVDDQGKLLTEIFQFDENGRRIPPTIEGTLRLLECLTSEEKRIEKEASKSLKSANLRLTHELDSAEIEATSPISLWGKRQSAPRTIPKRGPASTPARNPNVDGSGRSCANRRGASCTHFPPGRHCAASAKTAKRMLRQTDSQTSVGPDSLPVVVKDVRRGFQTRDTATGTTNRTTYPRRKIFASAVGQPESGRNAGRDGRGT